MGSRGRLQQAAGQHPQDSFQPRIPAPTRVGHSGGGRGPWHSTVWFQSCLVSVTLADCITSLRVGSLPCWGDGWSPYLMGALSLFVKREVVSAAVCQEPPMCQALCSALHQDYFLRPLQNPTRGPDQAQGGFGTCPKFLLVDGGAGFRSWCLASLQVRTNFPRSSPPLPPRHQDPGPQSSGEKGGPKFLPVLLSSCLIRSHESSYGSVLLLCRPGYIERWKYSSIWTRRSC